MKKLLPLARISAKKTFKLLRAKSPFYCSCLKSNVSVGRTFFNHISYSKRRIVREIIERLLIIPFLDDLLRNAPLSEQREIGDLKYFRLTHTVNQFTFSVIIRAYQVDKYELLSCFLESDAK